MRESRLPIITILLVICAGCIERDPVAPADPAPGYTELATAEIGGTGGQVVGGELTLTIPPQCFDTEARITILASADNPPFGSEQVTSTYRIAGLPETFGEPLAVAFERGTTGDPTRTFIALGEDGFSRSQENSRTRYRVLPTEIEGTVARSEIPAPGESRAVSGKAEGGGAYVFDCSVITGYTGYRTPEGHFEIYLPFGRLGNHVPMGQYLEEAYNRFLDLGFSYAARTKWPVQVTVKTLDDDGGAMSSRLGDDHGYIELALRILDDLPEMRLTCGHEFFHIVQGLYDPRPQWVQATEESRHYWVDEAAAVWSEELFTPVQDFSSSARLGYQWAPFHGMQKGAESNARHHGYGMSAVIKYLEARYGTSVLPTIFGAIRNEAHPIDAVCFHDPAEWWEDFMIEYVLGDIYDDVSRATWFTGAEDRFTIATPADTLRTWNREYTDLSGAIYDIRLSNPALRPSDQLVFSVSGAEERHLTIFRYNTNSIEFFATDHSSVVVRDLPTLVSQGWNLFALVTNNMYAEPYTTSRPITLRAQIPRTLDLTAATECKVVLNDLYVTYLFTDGRTSAGVLSSSWEVEAGTWNGNTFTGSSQGGNNEEISLTVDPVTGEITNYRVRSSDNNAYELVIEGALPARPDTGNPNFLAIYGITGTDVCSNVSSIGFSNVWGTQIIGRSCAASSGLEVRLW